MKFFNFIFIFLLIRRCQSAHIVDFILIKTKVLASLLSQLLNSQKFEFSNIPYDLGMHWQ